MVRESSDCVIETSDAECVSDVKTILICLPGFATSGAGGKDDLRGGEDFRSCLYSLTVEA